MKTIVFDPNGGRLSVKVTIGNAQAGSYILTVWEAQSNTKVLEEHGNSLNPNDDTHALPLPTVNNDERIVECQFAIADPQPNAGDTYSVSLQYFQDGKQIGSDEDSGPIQAKFAQPQIFDTLQKGA